MANKWLTHVKKTMKMMKSKGTYKKGMGLKQVIMAAKKTWSSAKKGMRGGEDKMEEVPLKAQDDTSGTSGSESDSTGAIGKGPDGTDVAGGRRRTRRRRHSRRR
jgi:hypothetical protein